MHDVNEIEDTDSQCMWGESNEFSPRCLHFLLAAFSLIPLRIAMIRDMIVATAMPVQAAYAPIIVVTATIMKTNVLIIAIIVSAVAFLIAIVAICIVLVPPVLNVAMVPITRISEGGTWRGQ